MHAGDQMAAAAPVMLSLLAAEAAERSEKREGCMDEGREGEKE